MSTKFSLSSISRFRWNVIDLIKICNAGSVPTYLFCDIDMSWAEQLRAKLIKQGQKTTVTAILIKAIGIAQLKHKESRSALLPWGQVLTLNNIVAGFTVEKFVDGGPAVYFGTIQNPHLKSIKQIAQELNYHAHLEPDQIQQLAIEHKFAKMPWLLRRLILGLGLLIPAIRLRYMPATFGISSLGKYAMKLLVPPCVCSSTFGIGSVENRAVVRGGEIVIRPIMSLVLNFDHRLIDGAPAARFLHEIRLLLEGDLAKYLDDKQEGSELESNILPAYLERIDKAITKSESLSSL